MAYVSALSRFMSQALKTEPGSTRRLEHLTTLCQIMLADPDDLVLRIVCDILADRESETGEVTYQGEHAASFSAFFNNSPAIANLRDEFAAWTWVANARNQLTLRLCDLGCGDGVAISHVIEKCISKRPFRGVRIFLNDTQEGMLQKSSVNVTEICKQYGIEDLDIYEIPGPAQSPSVTTAIRTFFKEDMDQVIVTAATSIHHMPFDQKVVLLKQLASLRPALLLIGDANSEHDVHNEPLSPEIVACTSRLYGLLYRSLKESGATKDVLKTARFFLGSEARNIIMKPASERIDYHTSVGHWRDLLHLTGFVLKNPEMTAPHLSPSTTRRLNTDHIESFVFEDESLTFTIAATLR